MWVFDAAMDWAADHIWWVLGGLLVATLLFLFLVVGPAHAAWVAECEAQGGHVISDTDTGVGVGVGAGGGTTTVVTTSTDYYCLNDAGGIIDVR